MSNIAIINDVITQSSEQFVSILSQYKWDLLPDTQIQAARTALTKSDYIMKIAAASPGDVHSSLMQAAILGLDLTEGKRQGWLLPRKNQNSKIVICLQVGFKGVEAIHQRMGVIDRLVIRVVRENDDFSWSGDDQEKPDHKANWLEDEKTRGEITGAYAITYYPDKTINVTVTSISHIYEKHRDRSESYKSYINKTKDGAWSYAPPWVSDEQSMVEKTMAYIAAKQWPANIRDESRSSKMLETLHDIDASDYTYGYTQAQKEAFFSFLDKNDSLGMYLFTHRVGIEVYSALTKMQKNTFEKGKRMAGAKIQNEFVELGHETFLNAVKAIDISDDLLLSECIEDVSDVTLKLLNSKLDKSQQDKLTELTNKVKD